MAILDTIALESNKLFKINFNGGDLSSDGGLLLIKEFAAKIGYQITSAYFQDDCADELTNDPVMTAILDKDKLASQPTLSRFGLLSPRCCHMVSADSQP